MVPILPLSNAFLGPLVSCDAFHTLSLVALTVTYSSLSSRCARWPLLSKRLISTGALPPDSPCLTLSTALSLITSRLPTHRTRHQVPSQRGQVPWTGIEEEATRERFRLTTTTAVQRRNVHVKHLAKGSLIEPSKRNWYTCMTKQPQSWKNARPQTHAP